MVCARASVNRKISGGASAGRLSPRTQKATFPNGFQAFRPRKNHLIFFWPVVPGSSVNPSPRHVIRAYMWLSIAAGLWDPDAKRIKETVAKTMSPQDILSARRLAQQRVQQHFKNC